MTFNDDYYLSVSMLRKLPYDHIGIRRFVEHLMPHTTSIRADLMSLHDATATEYGAVISNTLDLRGDVLLEIDDLDYFLVSNLRINMSNRLKLLLNVCFLDNNSYELSLSMPGWNERHHGIDTFEYLESLACDFVNFVQPIYGCLGIESNICGLSEIIGGEFFSVTDQMYFCSRFFDSNAAELSRTFDGYTFKQLDHGVYLRRERTDIGNMLPSGVQRQIGDMLASFVSTAPIDNR